MKNMWLYNTFSILSILNEIYYGTLLKIQKLFFFCPLFPISLFSNTFHNVS